VNSACESEAVDVCEESVAGENCDVDDDDDNDDSGVDETDDLDGIC
jgi:hypothetical protein